MINFIDSHSVNWCQGGHVFVWAGDPDYPIPEGYPCDCGKTVAHWEICLLCGQRKLTAKPINHEITYTLTTEDDISGSELK